MKRRPHLKVCSSNQTRTRAPTARSRAGAVLGDLVRDALVGAVVPRHRDQRGLAEIERAAKGRKELPRVRHGEPGDTKRPRELDEARIAKLGGEGAAEDPPFVRL